ncbi:MAG: hypothetical protein PHR81_06675 [Bacteroidales bacterium]|jgi:hypothetical protein|nr:hypothetical protein [Bacteroidales bacterium]MDD4214479.1 hypothetical protein [Bacteroidales bacterium]
MKKLLAFSSLLFIPLLLAAQMPDTLRRASGFYISPALTGFYFSEENTQPTPGFGLNAGYRYMNKWKNGLFIESGIGISWLTANYAEQISTVNTMGRDWTYSTLRKGNQLYVSCPFLFGYRTTRGKVRFQGSAGISFNIKYSDFEKVTISGDYPFGIPGTKNSGDELTFGTSFSAIVRAGISVPLRERLCIEFLPAFRYNFFSTKLESLNFLESTTTQFQNWSAGLDISLIWSLDNTKPQTLEEKRKNKETEPDYTYQYNTEKMTVQIKDKKKPKWYNNYFYFEALGSGLSYSFNYERTLFRNDMVGIQARVGYSFISKIYAFPVGFNITLGHATQKFEAGIYSTFESLLLEEFNVNIVPQLAYRLETKENFFLRLAVMSHIVTKTGEWLPGIGIAVGGCF